MTAGTGLTATTGNITASSGNVSASGTVNAGTTMTAQSGITATTGNITASSGNISAAGTVTAGSTITAQTGFIATTGNISALVGNVSANGTVTAGSTITAGTGLTVTSGTITTPSITTPIVKVAASTAFQIDQDATQIVGFDTNGYLTVAPNGGRIGFYGATPVVRAAAITQLTNTATGTQIATAVNAIIVALQNMGITL